MAANPTKTWRRTVIIDGHKPCTKCRRLLPADYAHFRKDSSISTGLRSHCRECDGNQFKFTPPKTREKPPERKCAICKKKLAPIRLNPEPVCFCHVKEWNQGGKGAHVVRR